jgi:phosphate uptake regulator
VGRVLTKGSVPVPDPTTLTTAQLLRELGSLRELIGARLDAADEATRLRSESFKQIPQDVQAEIAHLRALADEKFASVFRMFEERDVRTALSSAAADQALNAALQAAKELVTAQGEASAAAAVKSETSFTKQIDQIGTIIQTLEKAMGDRLTEIKERIDRGEGQGTGRSESRTERRLDTGQAILALTLVAAFAGVIVAIVFHK